MLGSNEALWVLLLMLLLLVVLKGNTFKILMRDVSTHDEEHVRPFSLVSFLHDWHWPGVAQQVTPVTMLHLCMPLC